jgi:hypothetical protein
MRGGGFEVVGDFVAVGLFLADLGCLSGHGGGYDRRYVLFGIM